MDCKECPFYKEHNYNYEKLIKEFDNTITETKKLLGEGAYGTNENIQESDREKEKSTDSRA